MLYGRLLEQARPVVHVHEQVEVAAWSRFTPSDGSKYADRPCTVTPRDLSDLVPPPAELSKGRRRTGWTGVRVSPGHNPEGSAVASTGPLSIRCTRLDSLHAR